MILFPLKDKAIINSVLSIKGMVHVVHVALVKSSGMQKLDGMNIIIQIKVQNHQNTFETISTTVLHGLLLQILKKNLEASYIVLWKPYLNEQKDFERLVLFRNGVT